VVGRWLGGWSVVDWVGRWSIGLVGGWLVRSVVRWLVGGWLVRSVVSWVGGWLLRARVI
jgi:hypothetical protein